MEVAPFQWGNIYVRLVVRVSVQSLFHVILGKRQTGSLTRTPAKQTAAYEPKEAAEWQIRYA